MPNLRGKEGNKKIRVMKDVAKERGENSEFHILHFSMFAEPHPLMCGFQSPLQEGYTLILIAALSDCGSYTCILWCHAAM